MEENDARPARIQTIRENNPFNASIENRQPRTPLRRSFDKVTQFTPKSRSFSMNSSYVFTKKQQYISTTSPITARSPLFSAPRSSETEIDEIESLNMLLVSATVEIDLIKLTLSQLELTILEQNNIEAKSTVYISISNK
ncbi:hypothetical protein O9G_003797 [Rozella allomycis CSF55]|uniref:Uncharacterized protein n=1 Tax=Rozella allomycis (strain CSF55) TaxID=988480 RepID=A0A075AVY1_ROZAC|nr:hypothetical protein O9G_003797 [Rozella allomycis CSF55]|eukprot:EPZ32669.1 hypothetical protein O9G_003797 [Rozella allomycis CSF55]